MWAEVKKQPSNTDVKPKWHAVGKIFRNENYENDKVPIMDCDGCCHNEPFTEVPYGGRNYSLFSILADVRNGKGFSGVESGERFEPISLPRGIPEDASNFYKEIAKESREDGYCHSYSWIGLDELEKYDWKGKIIKRRGLISLVWGEETYYDCVKKFVDETIPQLKKLKRDKSVLDVRIVFFFDN